MRMISTIALSAAVLALAGCGQKSDPNAAVTEAAATDTAVPAAGAAKAAGQAFADTAAASDAFEIAASKLAAANAKSPAIKSFAQKMIAAHTESTGKLKAAAGQASPPLTPDPALSPAQEQKVDSLKSFTGSEFDTAYAAAQVEAHQTTLAALKSYAASGDVPALKAFATTLVPTVTAHLNMAKALKP